MDKQRIKTSLGEIARFCLSGLASTALSYACYLTLLHVMAYRASYSLAYVLGLIVSFYANSAYVFKAKLSLQKFLYFLLVYFIQYALGLLAVVVWVEVLTLNHQLAPVFSMLFTVPLTYLMNRKVFRFGRQT